MRSITRRSVTRVAWWGVAVAAVMLAGTAANLSGQGGPQGRGRMMMGGAGHMADMRLIHTLLANGSKVQRTVTMRPDGVETITESSDPAIAATIQAHVTSMYARVKDDRPIHQRDPLFRAIFAHASAITFAHEMTPNGIKVVETSDNPYVVKLIQAHAEVLNLFIKNGHTEVMKNHEVPNPE
jgi:hypothetical protein